MYQKQLELKKLEPLTRQESRNSKLQEFIRNNWNSKKLDSRLRGNDEACAGMTKSNFSVSFPQKWESRTPNAAGIYRKKPKPNRLDSRLRGNDEKQLFHVIPAKAGI